MPNQPRDVKTEKKSNPKLTGSRLTAFQSQQDLAEHISRQSAVLMELKQKTKPSPTADTKDISAMGLKSPSEIYLERVTDKKDCPIQEKVKNFISVVGNDSPRYDEAFTKIMLEAMEQEKKSCAQGFSSFYQASNNISGVISDLFTEIHRLMNLSGDENYRQFRLLQTSFRSLNNVEQFVDYLQKNSPDGFVHDSKKEFQELGLCVNPFLFGNHNIWCESTFFFFAHNVSLFLIDPFSMQGIMGKLLTSVGLDELETNNILQKLTELATMMKKTGGRLFQIGVHESVIDNILYPAGAGGSVLTNLSKGGEIPSMKAVLESANNGTLPESDYFTLQARLFMHPDILDNPEKVKIHSYTHHPLNPKEAAEYANAIKSIAGRVISVLLYQQNSEKLFLSPKSLDKSFRIVKASLLQEEKDFDPTQHVQTLLQIKAFDRLSYFFKYWPELANIQQLASSLFSKDGSISDKDLSELFSVFIKNQSDDFLIDFIHVMMEKNRLILTEKNINQPFRYNSITPDCIKFFSRLSGVDVTSLESCPDDFSALMKFTETYLKNSNSKKFPSDSLFNIFLRLIDPKYLQVVLADEAKLKNFLEIIPPSCVVSTFEIFAKGKYSPPTADAPLINSHIKVSDHSFFKLPKESEPIEMTSKRRHSI